jgi:hypothetical protein
MYICLIQRLIGRCLFLVDLKELEMLGRRYTWVNNISNPTYEKLDKTFVFTEWDQKYPLSTVVALNRT